MDALASSARNILATSEGAGPPAGTRESRAIEARPLALHTIPMGGSVSPWGSPR